MNIKHIKTSLSRNIIITKSLQKKKFVYVVPVHDDQKLFEFLILKGMQAGLSWSTIEQSILQKIQGKLSL